MPLQHGGLTALICLSYPRGFQIVNKGHLKNVSRSASAGAKNTGVSQKVSLVNAKEKASRAGFGGGKRIKKTALNLERLMPGKAVL